MTVVVSRLKQLRGAVRGWGLRRQILLVTDEAGWILDSVARNLCSSISGFPVRVVGNEWRHARDCIIHFINRPWAWADGVLDEVHPSNSLIGLWWHGTLDSQEPGIQQGLRRLQRLHPRFKRIQVTCAIGRQTMRKLNIPEIGRAHV